MGPKSHDAIADALLSIADELRMQRALLARVARKLDVAEDKVKEHELRLYVLEPPNAKQAE